MRVVKGPAQQRDLVIQQHEAAILTNYFVNINPVFHILH